MKMRRRQGRVDRQGCEKFVLGEGKSPFLQLQACKLRVVCRVVVPFVLGSRPLSRRLFGLAGRVEQLAEEQVERRIVLLESDGIPDRVQGFDVLAVAQLTSGLQSPVRGGSLRCRL